MDGASDVTDYVYRTSMTRAGAEDFIKKNLGGLTMDQLAKIMTAITHNTHSVGESDTLTFYAPKNKGGA